MKDLILARETLNMRIYRLNKMTSDNMPLLDFQIDTAKREIENLNFDIDIFTTLGFTEHSIIPDRIKNKYNCLLENLKREINQIDESQALDELEHEDNQLNTDDEYETFDSSCYQFLKDNLYSEFIELLKTELLT